MVEENEESFSSVEEGEEDFVSDDDASHPFSQNELNDLVRDLSSSKSNAELLASRLLSDSAFTTVYRSRH